MASVLNTTLHFQSIENIWQLCDGSWSPQCKISIKAAIVYLLNAIWLARNNARFNSKVTHWKTAIAWILSNTSITGNKTSCISSSSMRDFMILKRLNVNLHPPKPTIVKEVLWQPPLDHWVKCNTDGASTSSTSSCGGIFRNHNADLLYCFAENIGRKSAFKAELCGAMRAIELANYTNWKNLWLESDSSLVVLAFKSIDLVPWELSNRWKNCLKITSGMNFVVSHVYREGNQCADGLANLGLSIDRFTIWNELPQEISSFFVDNRLGKPSFRIIHSRWRFWFGPPPTFCSSLFL
jgi:ribonuclease HI